MDEGDEFPYKYYVVYIATNPRGTETGALDVARAKPLSNYDEVAEVAKLVADTYPGLSQIVVTNWKRYEIP